jgi:phage terminase large subunit
MKVTPIYEHTLSDLKSGARRIIHQGGQWSGKTVGILGALAELCNEEIDGGVTTVTSLSVPHLKGGALRDFEMFVYPYFKSAIRQYHRTNHIFTFKSGSELEFKSFENEQTARGAKRKRLFINEANSFSKMLYFQLDSRSEQTIIDYNPSVRFWAHDELIGVEGNITYISDHRHNPFLTRQKHEEIESNKDPELWKVYARGLTGNVTGVIFPNWQMIDDEQFPDDDCIFGIDFGYTNDPTAIVKIVKRANSLYIKEIAYEAGLPPRHILQILEANGYDNDYTNLYCEHDPDMVKGLRLAGIKRAVPARKGPGSINAGIELLKTYNVFYTNSSRNLYRDISRYVWETDVKTGKLLNTPKEGFDHLFDAIRYAVYTKYLRNELKRA